jgi:hypothetical protein
MFDLSGQKIGSYRKSAGFIDFVAMLTISSRYAGS